MLSFSSSLLSRFIGLLRPVLRAEIRGYLLALLTSALVLKLSIVGLNVANSFVNRFFINALIARDIPGFTHYTFVYLGLFAALALVGTLAVFTEESLGLRWREWLTRHFFEQYLSQRRFYQIERSASIDNPDQRIADDIRTYTGTTLSLFLILFDATISLFSFLGVLWSITPWLVLVALIYAGIGSLITLLVGGRLIALNQAQLQTEADFRYALGRVRENAEAIAMLGGEAGERRGLGERLNRLIHNMRAVIAVNRNLRFFINLYGYLNPVVPILVVAPFFLTGQITDFGVVTQCAVAFPFVLGAFSVLINQFSQLSTLAVVINRLGSLSEAFLASRPHSCVELVTRSDGVELRQVTVLSREGGEVLIADLSLELPPGGKLLVVGPHGAGKSSLFRALAGLDCRGSGHVSRPQHVQFLPQRPYNPAGTLRHLLTYTATEQEISDEKLLTLLEAVQFLPVLRGRFTLDDIAVWGDVLSTGEQQQIAFARLLLAPPLFVFLDGALSALDDEEVNRLYQLLANTGCGYVTFSERPQLGSRHDQLLRLLPAGKWQLQRLPRAKVQ